MRHQSNTTRKLHAQYRLDAILTQVRAEFAAKYPTPDQQRAPEAQRWLNARTNELRASAGV